MVYTAKSTLYVCSAFVESSDSVLASTVYFILLMYSIGCTRFCVQYFFIGCSSFGEAQVIQFASFALIISSHPTNQNMDAWMASRLFGSGKGGELSRIACLRCPVLGQYFMYQT